MKNLTPHEKRVFGLVQKHPEIVNDKIAREKVASENNMAEKTVRNRIAELKRYGLIKPDIRQNQNGVTGYTDLAEKNYLSNGRHVDLFDYVQTLIKWRILFLSIVTISTLIAIVVSLLLPVWYKSTAVILPPSESSSPLSALGILGDVGFGSFMGSDQSQNRYLAILKSKELLQKVATRYNLQQKYNTKNMEEAVRSLLEKNMKVEVGDEMQISVSVWDRDQVLVADITNYVIYCLDSINIALSSTSARSNRRFLEERLNENGRALAEAEERLQTFQQRTGVVDLVAQVSALMETYSQFYSRKLQTYTDFYAQQVQTEIRLNVAKSTFNENNPTLQQLELMLQEQKNQLSELSVELDSQFEQVLKGIDQQVDKTNLTVSSEKVFLSFEEIPSLGLENLRLIREIELQSKILEILLPQYEQARFEEIKDIPTLQLLDRPNRPEKKDRPKRTIIVVLTFVTSLFFAMFGIILYDNYKQSLRIT